MTPFGHFDSRLTNSSNYSAGLSTMSSSQSRGKAPSGSWSSRGASTKESRAQATYSSSGHSLDAHRAESSSRTQPIPTPRSVFKSLPKASPSSDRRASFYLSPSMASSPSYHTINIAPPDSPPRLVTFTTKGHGFMWNEEIFLPQSILDRYADEDDYDDEDIDLELDEEAGDSGSSHGRREDLGFRRRRKEYDDDFGDGEGISGEVVEVRVTDDDIRRMMPE